MALKHKKKVEEVDEGLDFGFSNSTTVETDPNILPSGKIRYLHIDTEHGGMIIREEDDINEDKKDYADSYRAFRVKNATILGESEFVDSYSGSQYLKNGKFNEAGREKLLPITATRYYIKTSAAIKIDPVNTKKDLPVKSSIHPRRGCG